MRVRALAALAGVVLLAAPVAAAAVPWTETIPSCYANSALALVACERAHGDGSHCPGTSVASGSLAGSRCDMGGTHSTCITGGATGELGVFYWCYDVGFDGRRSTALGVHGVVDWRSASPGSCTVSIANDHAVGCPAGPPPSPETVPLTWGHVLP